MDFTIIRVCSERYEMGYNKYHNKKTEKYNRVWDSEMELDFYENQCLPRLKSGEYISVETQVTFILQKGFKIDGKNILPIKYVADFVITTKKGNKIIVDTKGMPPTADFKLKWKMLVNLLKEEYKYRMTALTRSLSKQRYHSCF